MSHEPAMSYHWGSIDPATIKPGTPSFDASAFIAPILDYIYLSLGPTWAEVEAMEDDNQ